MSLMPVTEALERILSGAEPLATEIVPLARARARILSADLAASRDQPPFPASAMDGYAVRSADVAIGADLSIVGRAVAGRRHDGTLGARQAVRIFTGAPVPDGADAILIQEDARPSADGLSITATETVSLGQFVRPQGLDFKAGDTLLRRGQRLSPTRCALAAAMNRAEIPVARRPRVALLATGDELVPVGGDPGPDQIIASNTHALAGMIDGVGGEAVDLGIARDTEADLEARIGDLGRIDVLVTLGGASVGDHDLVQKVLTGRGMALDFWKIAMRPGKPLMFGRLDGTHVLGLPGNPVSSIVCCKLFLLPLLRRLLGIAPERETPIRATLETDLPQNGTREDYMRAVCSGPDDALRVSAFERQDSSMLATLARANALIVRPVAAPAASAGDSVDIMRLD